MHEDDFCGRIYQAKNTNDEEEKEDQIPKQCVSDEGYNQTEDGQSNSDIDDKIQDVFFDH